MYQPNLIFIQVLLSLVIGMWVGIVFKDTAFMKYFEKNNWVVGLFLAVIGFVNFVIYQYTYLRNVSLLLIIIGLFIIFMFLLGKIKK
ncbi:hypothetical protein ACFLZ7_02565 [Nanoarchaeota archaeon]